MLMVATTGLLVARSWERVSYMVCFNLVQLFGGKDWWKTPFIRCHV